MAICVCFTGIKIPVIGVHIMEHVGHSLALRQFPLGVEQLIIFQGGLCLLSAVAVNEEIDRGVQHIGNPV
jgi:hypothetical protein